MLCRNVTPIRIFLHHLKLSMIESSKKINIIMTAVHRAKNVIFQPKKELKREDRLASEYLYLGYVSSFIPDHLC